MITFGRRPFPHLRKSRTFNVTSPLDRKKKKLTCSRIFTQGDLKIVKKDNGSGNNDNNNKANVSLWSQNWWRELFAFQLYAVLLFYYLHFILHSPLFSSIVRILAHLAFGSIPLIHHPRWFSNFSYAGLAAV